MTATDPQLLVARLRAAGCVFAEEEAALLTAAAASADELESIVAQRVSGQPLEHLLGWTEFRGLRVAVTPGVFVPRQRTGYLVEQAVALALAHRRTGSPRDCVVLDMCCGCGALGLAVGTELRAAGIGVALTATDLEPAAAACARTNLAPFGAEVCCGDLFAPLPAGLAGRVELLLANTPYVPTEAIAHMPPEARDHEPRTALDGGADGLDVIRRVAAAAGDWLAPGGGVFVETGEEQAAVAVEIFAGHGLTPNVLESEELGATVVCGVRP
ncbi:putative protein N(5)-glutamine methyltransferase [Nocardia sp. BMG111209]|uniref:putative protein N(5)-glutamine methyltransferase n=1 Tax=Nocardia sp. BMG111209 TaxID=1160137 RepID=UPI0003821D79|nr:putative protein N(5)-glutamine methyltransferase [Nocardia sp. BMG111209]